MKLLDFEEGEKIAKFLESMSERELIEHLKNHTISESDFIGEDPTVFDIDKPLDEWVKENNCHYLSEWIERMESI